MEEQENNNEDSFIKEQAGKAKDKAKDQAKKRVKQKIMAVVVAHLPVILTILAVTFSIIILIILFCAFLDILKVNEAENAADAKSKGVNLSLTQNSEYEEGQKGIRISYENGAYNISTNFTEEELQEVKDELTTKGRDIKDFSDFEVEVIGALMRNGLNVDSYKSEELKLLPLFIKAEACTGYLDLRPNSEKLDSSGNYKPLSIDGLEENQIPGTILLQRINTEEGSATTLEYIDEQSFNDMVSNNNIDATKYFTINENGNLVIATWEHKVVKVEGEYPEGVLQTEPEDTYTIEQKEISYNEYVKKYKMPFDFLVQLLTITDESEFCKEVANLAFNSKIVLNIQEEETIKTEVDKQTYDVHKKEEKRLNYEVIPEIEVQKNYEYILAGKKEDGTNLTDDEGNECTTYLNEKKEVTVTITTTSHTYNCEILEVDTWLGHYLKTYQKQEKQDISYEPQTSEVKEEYGEPDNTDEILNSEEILKHSDVQALKDKKEQEYRDKVIVPIVSVTSGKDSSTGKKYKQIIINYQNGKTSVGNKYYEQEIEDENGTVTYKYDMPSTFEVTTEAVDNIPSISFTYSLTSSYTYNLTTTKDEIIRCELNGLKIETYSKINKTEVVTSSETKYPSDPNPTTSTYIYAKSEEGELEKFLAVYDNHKYARAMFDSVSSWLFDMMENNENTVDLVDIIKYLLNVYDGTDYGVTELDTSIFEPADMNISKGTNALEQFIRYLHSWKSGGTIYKNDEGINCYKVYSDGGGSSAVGYGIDINTHGAELRNLGYDTSVGSLIPVDIVDEIEREQIQKLQEQVTSITSDLNLTQYQIYALMSRCYDYEVTGGLKQATSQFKYPSSETFLTAYNKYYTSINNEDYYGDYTKTDFSNKLFTEYMTWLDDANTGSHPFEWEYRRKSEWSLFQTGYYGYDLKHGTGHGIDEYYTGVSSSTDFTNNINLYNVDGTVNKTAIKELNDWITIDLLNTEIHIGNSSMQGGPFAKWWDATNNWFTSEYKFQCTWYVYGRANQFLELYGTTYKSWPGSLNNASTWYNSSTNGGEKYFECGSEPRPNSIAVWSGGDAGHVAFVEAVDTINNMVYISHAARGKTWNGIEGKSRGEMQTLYGYTLLGYVYLDSPKK